MEGAVTVNEWEAYCVGDLDNGNRINDDCKEFTYVHHISHIAPAINIVTSSEIRPSLVNGGSKLDTKRILVSWLSPNYWGDGFRYGNVRFQFKFEDLIENKLFYCVEDIRHPNHVACRILITDINRDGQLKRYDPEIKSGPWWKDKNSGKHYFYGRVSLEFMLEGSISLDNLKKIDFVQHHRDFCSENPKKCTERGLEPFKGGSRFLSKAVAVGLDLSPYKSFFFFENGKPETYNLDLPLEEIIDNVTNDVQFLGKVSGDTAEGIALARSVLSAYAFRRKKEAKVLANFFGSDKELIKAVGRVFGECFKTEGWECLIKRLLYEDYEC